MKLTTYVMAGDFFFTRSTSLLGRLIRWAETGKGEEASWANHVGVVVRPGHIIPPYPGAPIESPAAVVVEALAKTEMWPWWEAHKHEKGMGIQVYAPTRISQAQRLLIAEYAEKFVGTRYGWWKLFFHLADRLFFGGSKAFSTFLRIDRRPICSYVAALAAAHGGVSFGMTPRCADPDEMIDFCQQHPELFTRVVDAVVE